jgi:hypothetical protein
MGIAARLTKRTAVIASVSAVAIAGGVAFAAWTISGSGSASAQGGTASPVSFSAGSPSTTLYPGATGVVVYANATNPNPFPVDFMVSSTSSVNLGDCTPVGAVAFTPAGAPIHLAPGASSDIQVGTVSMSTDAENSCQGHAFPITIAGSGVSAS